MLNIMLRGQLDDLIREQSRRDWLREHGKTPSRRILFVGPPGSGKTMTAEALARALKLPLFVIRLEALITRFMGETAAKLRVAFDETAKRRGVSTSSTNSTPSAVIAVRPTTSPRCAGS